MDNTAIKAITDLALSQAANDAISGKGIDAVVISKDQQLQSLEHLNAVPDLFRGKFSTSVLDEFNAYINKHGYPDTAVFIDQDNMTAHSIIDMGDHADPQWGKHRAGIGLINTPAYNALLVSSDRTLQQQDFIDFAEDWQDNILFYFGDEAVTGPAAFKKIIQTLRRLKVSANASTEQTVGNFSATRSAMESIEIKAGQDELPTGFIFTATPHDGFEKVAFDCQLRAVNDDKNVKLKYRIGQLDLHKEQIANAFRDKIKAGITKEGVSIFIGNMSYQA